jgi:hypothetical protein
METESSLWNDVFWKINRTVYLDLLLGKNVETNKTKAIAVQQCGKHSSTTIALLLETVLQVCSPLVGSCNIWTTEMEMGVFSTQSMQNGYKEDSWGDPV